MLEPGHVRRPRSRDHRRQQRHRRRHRSQGSRVRLPSGVGGALEDKLEALRRQVGGDHKALAVRCDVTSWEDQQALVARTLESFGRMDAFFANAGFGAKRGFLEESPEHWKAMIDTNVYGAALSIRASLGTSASKTAAICS